MEKINIFKKLLRVQQEVDSLYKNKATNQYKYVDGNSVLTVIRPLMNELGLILKQEIISVDKERIDYSLKNGTQKSEILISAKILFTWVCCDTGETDVNNFFAVGMNDWDKGLGSALTYAERYFLLKYFHIPTDADDPDALQAQKENLAHEKELKAVILKMRAAATIDELAKIKKETPDYLVKTAEFQQIGKEMFNILNTKNEN